MNAKQIARYGLLTAMMLVLGFVERQFMLVPSVPGIKLGLSNTVLLYAVCLMGAKSAWVLMALKVLLSGLLFAGFTGMAYSFAGGLLSVAAMLVSARARGLGLVGVSVCGAAFHMAGQLLMSRLMLGDWTVAATAPLLLAAAVVTGVLTGIAARLTCAKVATEDPQARRRLEALGVVRERAR